MIHKAFQHRSGRVVSLSRLVLAVVFLIGIWLDPTQPSRLGGFGYVLLSGYLAQAAAFLAATWSNWRREARLAGPAHLIDLAVFTSLVFMTEGYSSPFFPFFVFIILSAGVQWGWRETALTAALVVLLFFAGGLTALAWHEAEFNIRLFIFRSTYLVVLSLVLVWFAFNQRPARMTRLPQPKLADPSRATEPPIAEAASYAAARTGAARILFAWWSHEEPWTHIGLLEKGEFKEQRHGPGTFGPLVKAQLSNAPFIFDLAQDRVLVRQDALRRRLLTIRDAIDNGFAVRFGIVEGLAIPVDSDGFGGVVFTLGVPGLCSDDLLVGEVLGEEISAALERASVIALLEEGVSSRARLALSRDLHDTVLQLLAGTAYRLEGIRKTSGSGGDIGPEVEMLQRELAVEQRQLRALIAELRGGRMPGVAADLQDSLRELAARMSRQWNVQCSLDHCPPGLEATPVLERDCHQLVREAVANAVRHGKASSITIRVDSSEDAVRLVVTDNGSGFPGTGCFSAAEGGKAPWSLSERVSSLGGHLALMSSDEGSQIAISLPLGEAR